MITLPAPSRSTDRRAVAAAVREDQRARIDVVTAGAFLDRHLLPHLDPPVRAGSWSSRLVQLDGTGAATLEISAQGRPVAFAKLFPDATGAAVFEQLLELRRRGLGAGSPFQVVRPLAFVAEQGLLLAEVAPGACVADAIATDDDALVAGSARAGSWLAALHGAPVRTGRVQPLLVTAEPVPLARRLAKAVARHPQSLPAVLPLLDVVEGLAQEAVEGRVVQCHGQYRPVHVFVDGPPADATTTVIDVDRSAPGDPARDVAEFLHRLRSAAHGPTGWVAAVEDAERAFLSAYRAGTGADAEEHLANLRLHRARHLVHSYHHELKSRAPDEDRMAFCRAELDALMSEEA